MRPSAGRGAGLLIDRQRHPGQQPRPLPGRPVVPDRGLHVHLGADPVPGIFAHQPKKSAPVFLAGPSFVLEAERFEQGILLFARDLQELLARGPHTVCV